MLRGPPGTVLSPVQCQETKGELQIIFTSSECKCAPITRFIARTLDYLMDLTNVVKNWILYKYFLSTVKSFYKIVEQTGKGIVNYGRFLT